MKKTIFYMTTIVFTACIFVACGSARLVNMWKDPTFHGELHNVLVVGLCENPASERAFEDAFVKELEEHGTNATAGYVLFGDQKPSTEQKLRSAVRDGGFDGLILTTVEGVETRATYTPGYTTYFPTVYRTYWGNYFIWYDRIREPGYYRRYNVLRLETSVWKIGQNERLIWNGTSEVLSPASTINRSHDVVALITDELSEKRVIS